LKKPETWGDVIFRGGNTARNACKRAGTIGEEGFWGVEGSTGRWLLEQGLGGALHWETVAKAARNNSKKKGKETSKR